MIKELVTEDFNNEINSGVVLVDFYAVWCGPCKMMHPVLEQIKDMHSDLKIVKIDVDQHEELARQYGVMSIPTLLLFKDGNVVEKNVGFIPLENIKIWIDRYLEK